MEACLYILNILRLDVRKRVFKTLFQAFLTQPLFVSVFSMQFTDHLTVIHFNTALSLQGELWTLVYTRFTFAVNSFSGSQVAQW